MDHCACGRPLWDGLRQCETCAEGERATLKRFRDNAKFSQDQVSGHRRRNLRNKLARQARGYE